MRSEDGKPQIKYKGIHEPKGRVKGYRVEIRPPNSAQKIWVGTFDTRLKAMRAFDAAVYLTGKDPYYYVYPENYLPPRSNKPSRETVQIEAKKFAEKTDHLPVNPASFLVDNSKAVSVEAPPVMIPRAGSERITLITPDVKAVEKMDTLALPDRSIVDEFLRYAEYLPVHALPALEANSFWPCYDLPVDEGKAGVEEAKVFVEEVKTGNEESAAFQRGLNAPDFGRLIELLDQPPPNVFPPIDDEFFGSFFGIPSKPSSKRKRDAAEGAGIVTDACESVGSSAIDVTAEVEWWNLIYNEPIKQRFDGWGTNEPTSWSVENL